MSLNCWRDKSLELDAGAEDGEEFGEPGGMRRARRGAVDEMPSAMLLSGKR